MKKFIEKFKKDSTFKKAGSGKKLAGTTSASSGIPLDSSAKPEKRKPPTNDARRAGEAALARVEANTPKEVNWSQQAIKARAKREMEVEKMMSELNVNTQQPESPFCQNPDILAVDGVYFSYMFLEGVSTYEVIKENIKELLYNELAENPGVVSCLIIHSCNKGKQKVQDCVQTLCKCLDNIIENPAEEKYRKIRHSTKTYQEKICPMEGAREFLQAAGFIEQILPYNEASDTFWVFPEDKLSDLQSLEELRDSLICAEPVKPQLDRDVRVLFPKQAMQYTEFPKEFFNLTADELRREIEAKKNDAEQRELLMTKAMREKMDAKEIKKYKFTIIRVKFPNEVILQGTFGVYEKLGAVKEFIQSHLVDSNRPFNVYFGGSRKLSEEDETLFELKFVPNVLLMFQYESTRNLASKEDDFLNEETMELLH